MYDEQRLTRSTRLADGGTEPRHACALAAARAGADRAMEGFRTAVQADAKADRADTVTEYDRAAQRTTLARIRASYPDEPIVAEEADAPKTTPATGPAWAVDPIDGTNNYVGGGRVWATSVAAVVDGEPVGAATVAPALGDWYLAHETTTRNDEPISVSDESDPRRFLVNPVFGLDERDREALIDATSTIATQFGDVRRIGCTQLALAAVAAGQLEAVVSTTTRNDWDAIAGAHLVRCAGGRVTDATGDRWTPGAPGIVASNDEAHDALVAAVER